MGHAGPHASIRAPGRPCPGRSKRWSPFALGQSFDDVMIVRNDGPADATGVSLTDVLPESLTVGSASASQGSCQVAGQAATCALGDLPAGSVAEVCVTVTPTATGLLSNTAVVAAQQSDPQTTGNGDVETTLVTGVQVLSAGSEQPSVQGATGATGAAPGAGGSAPGAAGDGDAGTSEQGQVAGSGSSLATTGVTVGVLTAIGLLLVAAGVAFVRTGRRQPDVVRR